MAVIWGINGYAPVSYTQLDVYKRQVYGGAQEGVRSYIEKIGTELEDTMKMCGVSSLKEITRECVFSKNTGSR